MEMGWTHCEGDHDIRRKRDEEYNLYSHCAHHNDDLLIVTSYSVPITTTIYSLSQKIPKVAKELVQNST